MKAKELSCCFPSVIVGRKYHAGAAPDFGETLSLRREPKNPYDSNAIAVCKEDGETLLGYLPGDTVAWLAPLADERKLAFAATLAGCDAPMGASKILVQVYGVEKSDWSKVGGPPLSEKTRAFHNAVLAVWRNAETATPELLKVESSHLAQAIRDVYGAPPETRFLIHLIEGIPYAEQAAVEMEKAAEERKAMEVAAKAKSAREALAKKQWLRVYRSFECAEAGRGCIEFGSLRILPLRAANAESAPTLCQALESGKVGVLRRKGDFLSLWVPHSGLDAVIAVQGSVLRATPDDVRVCNEGAFVADGEIGSCDSESIDVNGEPAGCRDEPKSFPRDHVMQAPAMPELPSDATGYAALLGNQLLRVRLYGSLRAAMEALPEILRLPWNLPVGPKKCDPQKTLAAIRGVLSHLWLGSGDGPLGEKLDFAPKPGGKSSWKPAMAIRFGRQAGVKRGGAFFNADGKLLSLALSCDSVRLDTLDGYESCPPGGWEMQGAGTAIRVHVHDTFGGLAK